MTIQEQDGRAVLQPKGELTIFEAADFRDALLALCGKPSKREIDLSNISRMDSSCVQLVVAACQEGPLSLTNVPPAVHEHFTVIGCESFLSGTVE